MGDAFVREPQADIDEPLAKRCFVDRRCPPERTRNGGSFGKFDDLRP
jgi:hypothetical protein